MAARILIIEDDRDFSRLLQIELEMDGHQISTANTGPRGLTLLEEFQPELIMLDIALPSMDGLEVCRRIRKASNVPILMMTGHAVSEEEIAEGLNAGADEYMIKPLRKLELQARVNALLRRAGVTPEAPAQTTHYEDDYLVVDLRARRVRVGNTDVQLTPTEFKLLATFIQHSGLVLTFQQLLEQVWGSSYTSEFHYPRIYVSHLRGKIEPDPRSPTYIQNEYGIGYRFMPKTEGAA
jgi:two-component system, OmpR family, KDP operon response regulator KdpE